MRKNLGAKLELHPMPLIVVGTVKETLVDEKYLREDGSIDYEMMAPIMFAGQRRYYKIGSAVKGY